MSRRQGFIEERSPGHWRIKYGDTALGKRRRFSVTVKGSRRDAERELRRRLGALDDGNHVDPTRITVGEWLARWLRDIHEEVSPRTHERYGELVRHFLVPALGALPIAKLTRMQIKDAYAVWATGGRRDDKPGGLSRQTRQHIHRVLHVALACAVEDQIIAKNPATAPRRDRNRLVPKIARKPMTALTTEQSARLLDALGHSHIFWPVLIALTTGARRGEILALRWKYVDLDRGVLTIAESLEQTRSGIRFKPPKSGRTRVVSLPSFAVDELRRLKREQAEHLLFLGVRQTGQTLLCARADGEPLQPQSLTKEFPRFLPRLGPDFPKVRFHDLRHTHATQLLAAGLHPKVAQERLGHSTIATTMDIYSHVTAQVHEEAAAKVDMMFRSHFRSQSQVRPPKP